MTLPVRPAAAWKWSWWSVMRVGQKGVDGSAKLLDHLAVTGAIMGG
jgi:hypothetical protein